jgi:hypothetical protein
MKLTFYRTHNADAKIYNAAIHDQMNLLSLYDPQTNKPIRGFSKTLAHIESMEGE